MFDFRWIYSKVLINVICSLFIYLSTLPWTMPVNWIGVLCYFGLGLCCKYHVRNTQTQTHTHKHTRSELENMKCSVKHPNKLQRIWIFGVSNVQILGSKWISTLEFSPLFPFLSLSLSQCFSILMESFFRWNARLNCPQHRKLSSTFNWFNWIRIQITWVEIEKNPPNTRFLFLVSRTHWTTHLIRL